MKKAFTDRPKRNFKKTFTKLYKSKDGTALNTVLSTPAKIITIKERQTSTIVGNTDIVDAVKFRQGVEILDDTQRMRGLVDISAGMEENTFENLVIGQTLNREDNNYFTDNNQQFDTDIKNLVISGDDGSGAVLPFYRLHFSGSNGYGLNINVRETARNLYDTHEISNGSIRIFDEKSFFSSNIVETETSPRSVIKNSVKKQSLILNQYSTKERTSAPFTEKFPDVLSNSKSLVAKEHKPLETGLTKFGKLVILNGNKEIKLISANAIVKTNRGKVIEPGTSTIVEDEQDSFDETASKHKTTKLSDNMDLAMRGVLLALSGSGSTDDYVGDLNKSASTGFVFDDAPFGTDSIAFR